MDDITNQLEDRLHDRNHVEIFGLLPSVMFMSSFSIESTTTVLVEKFQDELIDDGIHLKSELKRWYNMWKQEVQKRQQRYKDQMEIERKNKEKQALMEHRNKVDKRTKNPEKKKQRVDGKEAYKIPDPPDGFIDALEMADEDTFPNIRKLLLIGCVSPLGSCEAERADSDIRRLKTAYRSTMSSVREGNLNLIQTQRVTC